MAGISTPALAALGAVNQVRGTASALDEATGGDARRRRRAEEEELRLLDETQASRLAELREAQRLEEELSAAERRERAALIRAEAQEAERKRRSALRRSVSRTRAQLGSQGISSADGSGEAILLGLVRESEEERAAEERLEGLRLRALDTDATAAQRRNLLELTRLQERQRLERLARGVG
ncbi:hypothetical protein [Indioceanicola profundi]|uniref:hypothetical protein n=1 Tax=Indioceanicola profundi TaxID=2220096 RepID=UPI000E6AAC5A|nr:hypothetical protein [Indioceanicola profundi]